MLQKKIVRVKENFKGSKSKTKSHNKETPKRLSIELFVETLQGRRKWYDIFKATLKS